MRRKKDRFYELLQDYFNEYLPVAKGLSESTIISYKATFRLLMEYMYHVKAVASDAVTFSVLTQDCISGFLDWLENDRKCSVKASIKVFGKGRKVRRISIPVRASRNLEKYITHRRLSSKPDHHVFSSQTHEKMTVSCIEEIYNKYINRARNEHPDLFRESYSPHSMRHTTATHMLEAGVPLIVVKNFLGHVSLQTTQIYAEVTQETMNKQLKAWNEKWFLEEKKTELIPDFIR